MKQELLNIVLWISAATAATAFVPTHPSSSRPATLSSLQAKKAAKKKPKKSAGGGGGGFGAATKTKEDTIYEKAVQAKTKEVQATPSNARSWLELGSVLVKMGDYAEAEEVFRLGNQAAPGDEMLSGAYTALAGHSSSYFGGPATQPIDPQATQGEFDVYEVNQDIEDFRTVEWTARSAVPLIHVSKDALIPKDECLKAIQIAEEYAANQGGWTSSRHTQAATTDLPIKEIPELLEWFNDKLERFLFPMLASRYPKQIRSPNDLRAHDSFIVKYDGDREGAQNSLAIHTDESAFSFTIALNDKSDYEGGGTCFESIRLQGNKQDSFQPLTLNANAGGVVAFPGTIRHGGSPVTKGIRYIIPLFLYLHENKSGNEKGYVANQLVESVEKAQSRKRVLGSL